MPWTVSSVVAHEGVVVVLGIMQSHAASEEAPLPRPLPLNLTLSLEEALGLQSHAAFEEVHLPLPLTLTSNPNPHF